MKTSEEKVVVACQRLYVDEKEVELVATTTTSPKSYANIKPPLFDGKISWQIYKKQFEAADAIELVA